MKVAIKKARMYRNVSDYIGETASKDTLSMQQAGEIWTSTRGDEYLILSAHPGHCQVLKLVEDEHGEHCIPVTSRCMRYTCPSMVQYMTGNMFQDFVKAVPEEEYKAVMQAVAESLRLEIRVSLEAVEAHEKYRAMEANVERYAQALLKTKDQLESAREEIVELKSQVEEREVFGVHQTGGTLDIRFSESDLRREAEKYKMQAETYKEMYELLIEKMSSMAMKGA